MSTQVDLWLVRHADAGPPLAGPEDDGRALTSRGRRQCARLERALARLGARFDRLHHSPLVRAVQTAEALVPRLAEDGTTAVNGGLLRAPDADWLEDLAAHGGEHVAVVGHEPWLGALAFWLATGWSPAAPERQPAWVEFQKGSVLRLTGTLSPGGMRVRAFLDRRALRRIARR